MEIDAREVSDGAALETDLCVVGAGPAGISLAREFVGERVRVLLLESGGSEPEEAIQELNDGETIGDPYSGLRATRCRAVGGAAHLWNTPVGSASGGAKYAPLDPWDFSPRAVHPLAGWPFEQAQVRPFYTRAQALCGLGPFAYDGEDWSDDDRPCLPFDDGRLTTRVYQFGAGEVFTRALPRAISGSENVALCHHATVCGLERTSGREVSALACASLTAGRFRVRAKLFVLAAGAVENARLLLLPGGGSDAPGNRHGWVGRGFMEHLRDYALVLVPHSYDLFEHAAFYDAHPARGGAIVCGRIALTEEVVLSEDLPNASITLFPRVKKRRAFSWVSGRRLRGLRRFAGWRDETGYGWSRQPALARKCDAFRLLVNFEQQPNPENRIALASRRDVFGLPRGELHWRWRPEEQEQLERLRTVLATGLEAAHLGRVQFRAADMKPDPNAHHHAGTTRMHADPLHGVVDSECRVHGTDNLYVTGSSVFPTAGFANPTLTIVALALRLADHLKERI